VSSEAPLHDDELVAYLLTGLDEDYNPVFTAIVARIDPINPSELYSQLLSIEHHTNFQTTVSSGGSSYVVIASRGRGYPSGHGSSPSDRSSHHGRGQAHHA
jgi:hypothetical protein